MEAILVGVLLVLGGFWILSSQETVGRSGFMQGFVQSLLATWTKYGYRDSFQFRSDGPQHREPSRASKWRHLRKWLKQSVIGIGCISAGAIAIYAALGNLRLQAQPSVPSICPKVLPAVLSVNARGNQTRSASAKRPANFVLSGYRQVDEQIYLACAATQNYQYRLALQHFKSAWSVNHNLRKQQKAYVLDQADQSIKSAIKQVERQTQ